VALLISALITFLFAGSSAFADAEALTVISKKAASGRQELCVKPFSALRPTRADCLVVAKVADRLLTSHDPSLKFTELYLKPLASSLEAAKSASARRLNGREKGRDCFPFRGLRVDCLRSEA
jgi:hypothetical protein